MPEATAPPAPTASLARPRLQAPAGACDTHIHIYGPRDRYPLAPSCARIPPDGPLPAYRAVMERLGLGRVVIVQPSSPLTLAEDIDATVDLLAASGADTAVSVVKLDHAVHPLKMKVLEGDRLLPYLEEERGRMAAHELPMIYVRNCSVYATRRRVIDGGGVIGDDCRAYVMPRERSLDINEELDLEFAEFLLSRRGALTSNNAT